MPQSSANARGETTRTRDARAARSTAHSTLDNPIRKRARNYFAQRKQVCMCAVSTVCDTERGGREA